WIELLGVKAEDGVLVELANGLLGAQYGLAEWVVFPEILREYLMDEVVRIVFVHLDLFEDHAFFASDVFGFEYRIQDNVAEDVNGDGQVLVEDLGVEADGFFSGKGVHVATDGIHLARDVESGARPRA